MKAAKFDYVRAESLEHACKLLSENAGESSILAGGQSLVPAMNMRMATPALLIDINGLEELRGVSLEDSEIKIGALTRHVDLLESPKIAAESPLIRIALPHVAHVAIRNRGTIGGSLCVADPSAELPACMVTLGGRITLAKAGGEREVAAEDFFFGLYDTAKEDDEILSRVTLPRREPDRVSTFLELNRRRGDFALVGVAATARRHGDGRLTDPRIGIFGCDAMPRLATGAQNLVDGNCDDEELIRACIDTLEGEFEPMEDNELRAETRLRLAGVLLGRALRNLWAGGEAVGT